ncbi:MAG: hypothetical protein PHQ40_00380 [Anaerolineaceae bacterium]|nr:hypothetical protein [Anaerolineaceae bacterium]MDD5367512.1 hypothetical protein [Anaerolineaceae bacterium]
MSIWERISAALTGLSLPKAEGVYLAATGGELPNEYLVFFLIAAPPEQHADDVEKSRSYHVQVSYYNRAGLAVIPAIATAMTAVGFTRGPLRELPYNEQTRHFGLSMEFYYLEEEL